MRPVWADEQPLTAVSREQDAGQVEVLAQGYEQTVALSSQVDGRTINWTERQLIVRSHKLAKAATQALQARLAKAQAELGHLTEHKQGKKRYPDRTSLQQAAQAILMHYRVEGLLHPTHSSSTRGEPKMYLIPLFHSGHCKVYFTSCKPLNRQAPHNQSRTCTI